MTSGEKLIIRAANMLILKKVADIMKKGGDVFYETIGLSRGQVDRMIARERHDYKWKYEEVAKEMKMDPKVFTGERLIIIEGELVKYIRDHFEELIEADEIKGKLDKETAMSEAKIWEIIAKEYDEKHSEEQAQEVEEKVSRTEEIYYNTQKAMLDEVVRQTKEEDFVDVQLWRFWNYMRKK